MKTERTTGFARALGLAFLMASVGLITGCRQDMHDQAKYEPYEASPLFANGTSARPLVPHAVARGFLDEDRAFHTGRDASGQYLLAFPRPMTREDLYRGQQRYEIFCTPCHDRVGSGNGTIVQRGFTPPTSFHDERLRAAGPGYFVSVMTEGFGQMSSYAAQVKPEDRWRIAAYIRTLQLSQNARMAELTAADLKALEEAQQPGAGESGATDENHGGGHGSAGGHAGAR